MRFQLYGPATVRGMKVEWDVDVAVTDAIRMALHPQDADRLRVGRLKRAFDVAVRPGGRGKRQASPAVVHPKGALVFAIPNEKYFFVEVQDE